MDASAGQTGCAWGERAVAKAAAVAVDVLQPWDQDTDVRNDLDVLRRAAAAAAHPEATDDRRGLAQIVSRPDGQRAIREQAVGVTEEGSQRWQDSRRACD
jgi:hypothetical protein